MSISEVAVRDAELLAIEEINAAGGVLGKQIEPVVEDGASDWPTFAEKAEKLLTVDEVAVVFGGWTSASRKAMLPVFEGLDGPALLPGAVRGPRGLAEHLLHRRHHQPADHPGARLPEGAGPDRRSSSSAPTTCSPARPTRSSRPTPRPTAWRSSARSTCRSVTPTWRRSCRRCSTPSPQVVFNTLNGDSNVAFFKELKAKGNTPDKIQTISVSVAEEEVGGIGVDNIEGHLVAWNYYQTTDNARERRSSSTAFKAEYGEDRVTADPIEAGYNAVYIWAAAVEKAGSFDVDDGARRRPRASSSTRPRARSPSSDWNQHVSKTARIGMINAEGLIDEVWDSDGPIEPDPCLANYDVGQGPGRTASAAPSASGAGRGRGDDRDRTVLDAPAEAGRRGRPRREPRRSDREGDRVSTFLEQLFNGLSLASVLLLVALGLTFTFGQMGVINMAHGELIMAAPTRPTCCRRVGLFAGAAGIAFVLSHARRLRGRRRSSACSRAAAAAADVRPAARHPAGDVRRQPDPAAGRQGHLRRPQRRGRRPDAGCGATSSCSASRCPTPGCSSSSWSSVALVVVVGCSWPARRRAAACGRSCRTVTWPRSAACRTGRVDAITFFLGSGLAGIAGVAVVADRPDRLPDRHRLHRRRVPRRHRRRPRQAARRGHRRRRARAAQLVQRVLDVGQHRQGDRVRARHRVPAVPAERHRRRSARGG